VTTWEAESAACCAVTNAAEVYVETTDEGPAVDTVEALPSMSSRWLTIGENKGGVTIRFTASTSEAWEALTHQYQCRHMQ
jgi:hypothetical protein